MEVFDNYEISPCRRYEEPNAPGKFYFEVCDPHEADVWTLYGHVSGEGAQAIGDFANQESAEQVFFRITGLKFTGSYKADAHIRVKHAGPKLLQALIAASDWINAQLGEPRTEIQTQVQNAIAVATGQVSPDLKKPIVIEVRGGVVQDVLNVPSGIEYEIRDYDQLNDQEDAAAGGSVSAHRHSAAPWAYEYSPYQGRQGDIPAFAIFDADSNKVFDTNEDTDADLQETNARLGSTAPRLLAALIACANLLADYDEAEGEEGDAYREALAAIAEATGRAS